MEIPPVLLRQLIKVKTQSHIESIEMRTKNRIIFISDSYYHSDWKILGSHHNSDKTSICDNLTVENTEMMKKIKKNQSIFFSYLYYHFPIGKFLFTSKF